VGGYGGDGAVFAQMLAQATAHRLLSDEPFTVDGPLLEAWAGPKRFKLRQAGF